MDVLAGKYKPLFYKKHSDFSPIIQGAPPLRAALFAHFLPVCGSANGPIA